MDYKEFSINMVVYTEEEINEDHLTDLFITFCENNKLSAGGKIEELKIKENEKELS